MTATSNRGRPRPALWLALAGLLMAGLAGPAAAQNLPDEMGRLAKAIAETLEEEKQQTVAIGEFTGPAQLDTNFGPGLMQQLSLRLSGEKVIVNKTASMSIKGRYARVEDKDNPDSIAVKLTIDLFDKNDDVKKTFKAEIRDNTAIAQMLGLTVSLPPKANREDRNERLKYAADRPGAFIDGTKVRSSDKSPYAIEVLVRARPGAPAVARKPVLDQGGQVFVDVKRGELYEVKVYNDSKAEAAVAMAIDGLDQFAFSDVRDARTNQPKFGHYIIDPVGSYEIKGWHRNNSQVDSFLVTAYGKGAAAMAPAKSLGKTGVLTVSFRAASSDPKGLPDDDGARSANQNETGFGPPQKVNLKEVKRTLGVVRDVVSIRYTR